MHLLVTLVVSVGFFCCGGEGAGEFICSGGGSVSVLAVVQSDGPLQCETASRQSQFSETVSWRCFSLEAALKKVADISLEASDNLMSTSCVRLDMIAGGIHVITAPVEFGSVSVEFVGHATIHCSYIVDVDPRRLFDPDYDYVNYTMSFSGSDYVSFDSVEFVGCPYPLRLERVRNVAVRNSTFRRFSEAVLDIFNCVNVTISDSTFFNNSGTGISRVPFRGNGGAIAIGYNSIDSNDPIFVVTQCNFTNNRATAASFFRAPSNAVFNGIYTGRGGAIAVFINETTSNISGVVTDCVFVENYVRLYGGALFSVAFGQETFTSLQVERNIFEGNVAELGGGATITVFFSEALEDSPHTALFKDCSFTRNIAETGGASLLYLAYRGTGFSFYKVESCNFTGNLGVGSEDDFGSAIATWQVDNNLRDAQSEPQNEIVNCTFEGSTGKNGIVTIGYVPFAFFGSNLFINNGGTSSLRIIGALVDFHGHMEFRGNSADAETALEVASFGQIRLNSDLDITFFNNTGRFGASISSLRTARRNPFGKLGHNPQCFMLYEDPAKPPSEWVDVLVVFDANQAVLASSLYLSDLDSCSFFTRLPPFFDPSSILEWPVWSFGNNSQNHGFKNSFDPKYQVQTTPQTLQIFKRNIAAWPGQRFNISLTAWDQFQNPTTASIRFIITQLAEKNATASFLPEVVIIDSESENSPLVTDFLVEYTTSSKSVLVFDKPIGNVSIDVIFESSQITETGFMLFAALCPGGYELVSSPRVMCRCKETDTNVLNCEDDQDSIIIKSGLWVSTVPSRDLHRHEMNLHICPAGYCRCFQNSSLGPENCVYTFINSNPDAQCDYRRQGVLCGECKKGLGLSSLLDQCVTCSNLYWLLVLLLIVVDASAMVTIILVDHKLPEILYSFTFYLHVVPIVALYFPETFIATGQYLYYFSSFLSFYLPYDFCLSEGTNPLVSYFLRLVPFLLALLLIPFTFLLKPLKARKTLRYRGLWIVIVLLYTRTVHTSMSILSCSQVTVHDNGTTFTSLRWFVSGGTVCFTGWHAPLAVLAIVLLLLCILLIPLVACIATGKIPKKLYWLRDLQLPLSESYKKKWSWWAAVELGRRFLSILIFILSPRDQAYLLLFLCIILVLHGYIQPYTTHLANALEIIVELSILFLLLMVSSQVLDPHYGFTPLEMFRTAQNRSKLDKRAISDATWMLTPIYYFPIVLFAFPISVLLCRMCILHCKNACSKDKAVINYSSGVMEELETQQVSPLTSYSLELLEIVNPQDPSQINDPTAKNYSWASQSLQSFRSKKKDSSNFSKHSLKAHLLSNPQISLQSE